MHGWATQRGIPIAVPDLNGAGFSTLTIGSQLVVARAALTRLAPPILVVGSSLGSYLAALLVQEGAAVHAALLMCPAFDFARRLAATLGPEAMALWRERGTMSIYHHSEHAQRDVGIALIDEAEHHPFVPAPRVPFTLVHGRHDVEVPVAVSRAYVAAFPAVRLVEVEDDHTLASSMDVVLTEAAALLARL